MFFLITIFILNILNLLECPDKLQIESLYWTPFSHALVQPLLQHAVVVLVLIFV